MAAFNLENFFNGDGGGGVPTLHGARNAAEFQAQLAKVNAYAMEDPLRLLHDAGRRDALAQAHVEQPYRFIYRDLSGRLDHALLSPALALQLRGAAEWHVNADWPDADGYRERNLPGSWRSFDHDPESQDSEFGIHGSGEARVGRLRKPLTRILEARASRSRVPTFANPQSPSRADARCAANSTGARSPVAGYRPR